MSTSDCACPSVGHVVEDGVPLQPVKEIVVTGLGDYAALSSFLQCTSSSDETITVHAQNADGPGLHALCDRLRDSGITSFSCARILVQGRGAGDPDAVNLLAQALATLCSNRDVVLDVVSDEMFALHAVANEGSVHLPEGCYTLVSHGPGGRAWDPDLDL